MKLRPVTKFYKRDKKKSKYLTKMSCQKIMMSLPFFQSSAILEKSGNQTPDAQSVKLIFSLIVTFYLKKVKAELKRV